MMEDYENMASDVCTLIKHLIPLNTQVISQHLTKNYPYTDNLP